MRNVATSVLELVGASSISVGAFLWDISAGFVVSGVFALLIARQAARV